LVSNFKFQIKNWLLLFLFLAASAVWLAIFRFPEQKIKLVFCDVGEGDAALIIQGSTQVLIDTGPNDKVLDCLSRRLPFWDKQLELVLITHSQKDHAGGLPFVKKYYSIQKLLDNTDLADNQQLIVAGLRFLVFNPDARVLGAASYRPENNANALVLELQAGHYKALFTSDINTTVEKKLTWNDVDLLKVAHHGSKYSTSEVFLAQTRPETAIISVGKNSYGHPTQETLSRLATIGARILRTDQEGDIVLSP
jgi:competence protein ComEC